MKTLCQQYISDVKSFFPSIRRKEKIFIKNLKNDVECYCEENTVNTISELYNVFGQPNEIVNSYYSDIDIQPVLKNIKTTRYLKTGIIIFILISVTAASIFGINAYLTQKAFEEQDMRFEEFDRKKMK